MPEWSLELRHLYWMLRYLRAYDQAGRRRYYRRIEKEKRRLEAAGVDPEAVRLLCLHLADPRRPGRWERFEAYEHERARR